MPIQFYVYVDCRSDGKIAISQADHMKHYTPPQSSPYNIIYILTYTAYNAYRSSSFALGELMFLITRPASLIGQVTWCASAAVSGPGAAKNISLVCRPSGAYCFFVWSIIMSTGCTGGLSVVILWQDIRGAEWSVIWYFAPLIGGEPLAEGVKI